IIHETRRGEMAALGEVPFGRYYGSVDATPLFILLAGSYYERTADYEFVEKLWPHIERALSWIDRYGDKDGDGFVEYSRDSDNGTYALALDGKKQPCRVRTSNAGHCLSTNIASPEHAHSIEQILLGPDFFNGWGVRTVGAREPRYNPVSYHNGSVWPHDNSLIAAGLARYGFKQSAARILAGLLDTSIFVDLHRLPVLFCGLERRPGEAPTLYPAACAPQAWAAGSVYLLLEACL